MLLVLLAASVLSLLGAAPASAHARFTGSDPAEGAEVTTLPDVVVLSYSEDVAPQFVETAVITPDGATVPTTATADGRDVAVDLASADVPDAALGGTWQVVARVVSVDGHPVEHTTSFVVPAAGATGPSDDPSDDPTDDPAVEGAAAAGATAGPSGAAETSPVDDATAPATDPTTAVTDALPRWAVAGGAAALVLAAAAALLVQLRRRPPTG